MRRFEAKDVPDEWGHRSPPAVVVSTGRDLPPLQDAMTATKSAATTVRPKIGGPKSAPWEVDHDISVTDDCEGNAPHRRSISLRTASIFGSLQPATDLRASPQTVRKYRITSG